MNRDTIPSVPIEHQKVISQKMFPSQITFADPGIKLKIALQ